MSRSFSSKKQPRTPSILLLLVCWLSACSERPPKDGEAGKTTDTSSQESGHSGQGIVIEEVGGASALERAGVQVGDVFLAWERLPNPPANPRTARGTIAALFDWQQLVIEQAPRGTVKLSGERQGQPVTIEVQPGRWSARARGQLPAAQVADYRRGEELRENGDLQAGVALWQKIVTEARDRGLSASWLELRIAKALTEDKAREEAISVYESALKEAQDAPIQAILWDAKGQSCQRLGDLEQAEASCREGLRIRQELQPRSLAVASSLTCLGNIAARRADLESATELHQRALEIRQHEAPGSLEVAASLNRLGDLAEPQGTDELAEGFYRQALAIQTVLDPEGLDLADTLNGLGILARRQGDLDRAADLHERALRIWRRLIPQSMAVAASLNNLGIVLGERGEMKRAAEYFHQALAIEEKLFPGSFTVADKLNNLGINAFLQGDMEQAEDLLQRALAIYEQLDPGKLAVADALTNLGRITLARGDLERATEYFQRALTIRQRVTPEHFMVSTLLEHLGIVAQTRGRLEEAGELFEGALKIREKTASGSTSEADTLEKLAKLYRQRHQSRKALDYFLRSLDALEAQIDRLGGSRTVEANFRAQHGDKYRGAVELLLEEDRPEDAFAILERSRARSFLALLKEKDLTFDAEVPPELDETRQRLVALHDRALHQLAELNPAEDGAEIETLRTELRGLRQQYDENAEKIRRASPKLAALQDPEPLDLDGVRATLDPGTLLLSYSVGEARTDVFASSREQGLSVATVPVGESELRQRVATLSQLVPEALPDSALGVDRLEALRRESEKLYATLLAPIATRIEESERLLIIPDVPLHALPWSLLIRETADTERGWRYLIEQKPIHLALSATVHAELKQHRHPSPTGIPTLTAFGDPLFPHHDQNTDAIADLRQRSSTLRDFDFQPLPASRVEAERIAELYGRDAHAYLGAEATEERAKAVDRDVRYLHFATHAILDESSPLDSALVLTLPESFDEAHDNGLLQAWEIFEQVRLDAELVVLSSCESALGKSLPGEGLIGLSRAFQYAGARSVVASLWKVADASTAELMIRFHHHLRQGLAKDAALRAAQLELIQGQEETSAPYFWAGFQLFGDWL